MDKNKKSVAQEVRQKRDISKGRSKCPLLSLFCLQHGRWETVRPVRGHFTLKINITLFIRNWMLNIFLFNNFFKKAVFSEKIVKICFLGGGDTLDNFLEEGSILRRKLT